MDSEDTMREALNESSVSLTPGKHSKERIPLAWKLLTVGLLMFCCVLLIVSLTLAATHGNCANINEDKIWTFAVANHDGNIAYVDNRTGEIRGYNVDVINAVCQLANKDCAIVWDEETNCWDSTTTGMPHGGSGLFNGWYDGCAGWIPTKDRLRTFAFSKPYLKGPSEMLWINKSVSTTPELPIDVTNKVIGFVDGWHTDEFCLQEHTNVVGFDTRYSTYIHYQSVKLLIDAINSGEIDLAFCSSHPLLVKHLTPLTPSRRCGLEGPAVMHRKDSRLSDWWDPAIDRLIKSDQYKEICEDLSDKHGHKPGGDASRVCLQSADAS